MRNWSKDIFSVLSFDWPHLRFKILLAAVASSSSSKGKEKGKDDASAVSGEGKETTDVRANRHTTTGDDVVIFNEGADELLIQFETDSQTLPPEGALNRFEIIKLVLSPYPLPYY
jgi:hypothetical protein